MTRKDNKKAPKRASDKKTGRKGRVGSAGRERDQGIMRGPGGPPPEAPSDKKTRGKSQKTVVKEIRKRVEEKLAGEVGKAGLGDYIKLVALEKELAGDTTPKEMKVTWVPDSEK